MNANTEKWNNPKAAGAREESENEAQWISYTTVNN